MTPAQLEKLDNDLWNWFDCDVMPTERMANAIREALAAGHDVCGGRWEGSNEELLAAYFHENQ